MKTTLLAGLMVTWATYAAAHSPLEATIPANEETMASVPAEIVLDFKGNVRLTRVVMTHASHEADLDLAGFEGFISDYTIQMPSVGAGTYQIEWRGLGDDGHPMDGRFSFTVEE